MTNRIKEARNTQAQAQVRGYGVFSATTVIQRDKRVTRDFHFEDGSSSQTKIFTELASGQFSL